MEEIIDLYDMYKQKLNRTWIRGVTLPENAYRHTIHICLFNSLGQLLIQKRTANKRSWPNLWDISVGGGVSAGETSNMAATKEFTEELGLQHDFSSDRPFLTIHFDEGFSDVFVLHDDVKIEDLVLQESEVCDARWAAKNEILQLIDEKLFIPYKKPVIELLFEFAVSRGALN